MRAIIEILLFVSLLLHTNICSVIIAKIYIRYDYHVSSFNNYRISHISHSDVKRTRTCVYHI